MAKKPTKAAKSAPKSVDKKMPAFLMKGKASKKGC